MVLIMYLWSNDYEAPHERSRKTYTFKNGYSIIAIKYYRSDIWPDQFAVVKISEDVKILDIPQVVEDRGIFSSFDAAKRKLMSIA